MALEELSTTMSKISFGFFGSESEKKVGSFLFNDKTEWASSRELHGLAALTFNDRECAGVMVVIGKALEPKDNTWRTLHKAVRLLHHFVLYGAERCVDHAWDHQRRVEELQRYNSAIHGRTAALNGGGTDFGGPVRKAATELVELLKDTEAIREAREEGRAPDALLPMGAPDDYRAPTKAKEIDLGNDDVFGIIPQGSMGAKFDLKQVPGMYEGRPERYFDNKDDPRRRTKEVEESDYTRQALAPDLLDLDLGEAQSSTIPESQDLVRASKEAALQEQLQAQQQQLEKLKLLMVTQAQQRQQQPGGVAATGMEVTATGPGTGMVGVSNGLGAGLGRGARSGNPADRVMEAFGSVGLGGTSVASPGLVGGGAMASPIQTSGEGVGSLMGGVGSNGGGAVGVGMAGRGQHNLTGIGLGHGSGGGGGGLMGNAGAPPMQQLAPGGNPQQVGLGARMGLGMGGVSGGMGGVGISGGAASGLSGGITIGGGGGVGLAKPGTHGGVGTDQQRQQWFPGQG